MLTIRKIQKDNTTEVKLNFFILNSLLGLIIPGNDAEKSFEELVEKINNLEVKGVDELVYFIDGEHVLVGFSKDLDTQNLNVIPFQKHDQKLPFNVAGLDTIKYSAKNFERRAKEAIGQAIEATKQIPTTQDSVDQVMGTFICLHITNQNTVFLIITIVLASIIMEKKLR